VTKAGHGIVAVATAASTNGIKLFIDEYVPSEGSEDKQTGERLFWTKNKRDETERFVGV